MNAALWIQTLDGTHGCYGWIRSLRIHLCVRQYPTFLLRAAARTLRRRAAARPAEAQKTHPTTVSPLFMRGTPLPSLVPLSAPPSTLTRISPAAHVHVHSRVAKELCGAQGPDRPLAGRIFIDRRLRITASRVSTIRTRYNAHSSPRPLFLFTSADFLALPPPFLFLPLLWRGVHDRES